MDDFGDNFDQPEVDPAADFLARQQNQLEGLEDDLGDVIPTAAPIFKDEPTSVPGMWAYTDTLHFYYYIYDKFFIHAKKSN